MWDVKRYYAVVSPNIIRIRNLDIEKSLSLLLDHDVLDKKKILQMGDVDILLICKRTGIYTLMNLKLKCIKCVLNPSNCKR